MRPHWLIKFCRFLILDVFAQLGTLSNYNAYLIFVFLFLLFFGLRHNAFAVAEMLLKDQQLIFWELGDASCIKFRDMDTLLGSLKVGNGLKINVTEGIWTRLSDKGDIAWDALIYGLSGIRLIIDICVNCWELIRLRKFGIHIKSIIFYYS